MLSFWIFTFVGFAGTTIFFVLFNDLAVQFFRLFLLFYLLLVTSRLRKLTQLHVQGIVFDPLVLCLKQGIEKIVEPQQGVHRHRPSLTLRLIEVFFTFRVSSLIRLQPIEIRRVLTFLRGRPRPRPLVGGARVSPPGPVECFIF